MKAKSKPCSFCPTVGPLWRANPATCPVCAKKQAAKAAAEKAKGQYTQTGLVQTEDGKTAKAFKYRTVEIKKISTRQQRLNAAYKVLRDQFMKSHPFCEAGLDGCLKASSECHHRRGRGEYLLDESTYMALCGPCHKYINEHNSFAMEKGFCQSRLSKVI